MIPAEVQKILKKQEAKVKLADAIQHEKRLELHSRAKVEDYRVGTYLPLDNFLKGFKRTLDSEIFEKVVAGIRLPVETVSLTDDIYQAFEKVFRAKNPVKKHVISDERFEAQVLEYFEKYYGQEYWRMFFERSKYKIQSIMYMDFPEIQESRYPEPKIYFIDSDDIVSFSGDFELDYFGYCTKRIDPDTKQEQIQYIWVDDESYQVFNSDFNPISYIGHTLGFCPARWMWTDTLDTEKQYLKKNNISPFLGDLDRLLEKHLKSDYLRNHASTPIIWTYQTKCDHRTAKEFCQRGLLYYVNSKEPVMEDGFEGLIKRCPSCKANSITGPGTIVKIPIPKKDDANIAPPVGIIEPSVATLEYNDKYIKDYSSQIFESSVGSNFDVMSREAVNADQVKSSIEERVQVLEKLKINFEKAMEWTYKTIGKGLIGDTYRDCSIDLGTEFYLVPPEILKEEYAKTLQNQSTIIFSDSAYKEYINTKYQNNKSERIRHKILSAIDPALHTTSEKLEILYTRKLIAPEDYYFKINFWNYIRAFEMQYGPVEAFLIPEPFDKRIDVIKGLIYSNIKINDDVKVIE